MFLFEYAQNRNGRFAAWIEGDMFPTREAALSHASARGFKAEGDDFLLTEFFESDSDGGAEARFCRNAFDR